MFDNILWDKAVSVPSMDTNSLLQFMYDENFIDQISLLCKVTVHNDFHLYIMDRNKGGLQLVNNGEILVVLPIFNMCMANPEFRSIVGESVEEVEKLCRYITGKYDPMKVDFSKMIDVPLSNYSEFEAYMKYTGLDCGLKLVSVAHQWTSLNMVQYDNEYLGSVFYYNKEEVLDKERLRPLYAVFVRIKEKLSNGEQYPNSIKELFETGITTDYSAAWRCLVGMFGMPEDLYPVKSLDPNYWFCGRKIKEFREYMSAWVGDPTDYFCGTDYDLGFSEDIHILAKAIDAYKAGQKYMKVSFIVDWHTGDSKVFRALTEEVLSEKRLSVLRDYVKEGYQAYNELKEMDYTSIKEVSLDNLERYGFGDTSSEEYKVYQFLMNEKLPNPGSAGSLINAAAGDK